jgi:hypothetical protein
MTSNSTQRTIAQFIRQPGLILAVINFCIGLVWIGVIQPLDAPDEPGHLQAIMQVRKQHILPEVHYARANPAGVVGPAGDAETRAYIARLLAKLLVNEQYFLVPYESFQAPLYYLAAGLLAHLLPADPRIVLYVGRLVALLLGAGRPSISAG